jgi:hypothetical protein
MYCYCWGFSQKDFWCPVSKAAFSVLGRRRDNFQDNDVNESMLKEDSIRKIYKSWARDQNAKWEAGEVGSLFKRRNYLKEELCETAPPKDKLYDVVFDMMRQIKAEPQCTPKCSSPKVCWWRIYRGDLDGDLSLSPKALSRSKGMPKISLSTLPE